jgi:CheY-like chemotaxis protein
MDQAQHILVIEDDPILRDLIAEWLLIVGYRVGLAAEGDTGLREARAHRPALVVTDINMPGIGGAAVIAGIAQTCPGTPVIAISGHFNSGHGLTPEAALALGASRTLTKPFRRKDMVSTVIELVGPPEPRA